VNFSPLSLSEVARRRRALQPFWSPQVVDLTSQREQNDEEREEAPA
jgi:hypothetical protein